MTDFVAVCRVEWWFDGKDETDHRAFLGSSFVDVMKKLEDYYGEDCIESVSIQFIDETAVPLTEEFAQYLLNSDKTG